MDVKVGNEAGYESALLYRFEMDLHSIRKISLKLIWFMHKLRAKYMGIMSRSKLSPT